MQFKIYWVRGEFEDSLVVSGETVADCQREARKEMAKRGWKDHECYSKQLL